MISSTVSRARDAPSPATLESARALPLDHTSRRSCGSQESALMAATVRDRRKKRFETGRAVRRLKVSMTRRTCRSSAMAPFEE